MMSANRAVQAKNKMLLMYAAGVVVFTGCFSVLAAVALLISHLKLDAV